jgi:dynein heavy chain
LQWNIRYDFADSDLRISIDQLRIFVDDPAYPPQTPPFAALAYLTGECNYGGRVTDDNDRRTLMALLSDIYENDVVFVNNYKLTPSGIYTIPSGTAPLTEYIDYIRSLPFSEGPEVFGLNENANISTAIQETNLLLSTALALQPRGGGSGGSGGGGSGSGPAKSADEILLELTADISSKVPDVFDIEAVEVKYPVAFEESMNTVLTQECMRYNNLIAVVKRSLKEVGLAIRGLSVMSAELEAVGIAAAQGRVPEMWKSIAYPSVKPLGSWVADLVDRLNFLQHWIDHGKPPVFWVSGFFFTQSFLTGARQNYARKYHIPIDELGYDYRVLSPQECSTIAHAGEKAHPPADGVYIKGLFLQSASWDGPGGVLAEARPRELFSVLPIVHLLPIKTADIDKAAHRYACPVYKTSERAGILSTTGHSTNYVMPLGLPMAKEHSQKHWIKRGTALFTSSDT